MNNKIDFVLMWVDPSDPKWLSEKNKYTPNDGADASDKRYRDWDNLRYWFRGVEKYAPWVNNIYFITYGHLPKWLNTKHPKLKIVKHSDFIPEEYLPTFSANPIEMNVHRIKGLSDNFVLFNDDIFLINPTKPKDFFKNDLPRDAACMYINIPSGETIDAIMNNDIRIINKHFSAREVLKKDFLKWFNIKNGKYLYNNVTLSIYNKFIGIHFSHLPTSFKKDAFEEIWKKEFETLDKTCRNKFRSPDDVNQWLVKYWQICKGNFSPRSVRWGKYYEYGMGYKELRKIFNSRRYLSTCLNDTIEDSKLDEAIMITNKLFEKKFPEKSEFEI